MSGLFAEYLLRPTLLSGRRVRRRQRLPYIPFLGLLEWDPLDLLFAGSIFVALPGT